MAYKSNPNTVYEVYDMLVDGQLRHQILTFLNEKYDIKERAGDLIIKEAKKIFQTLNNEKLEKKKNELFAKYMNIYAKAVRANNLKVAKDTLDSLVKLYGLDIVKVQLEVSEFDVNWGNNLTINNINNDKEE